MARKLPAHVPDLTPPTALRQGDTVIGVYMGAAFEGTIDRIENNGWHAQNAAFRNDCRVWITLKTPISPACGGEPREALLMDVVATGAGNYRRDRSESCFEAVRIRRAA